MGGESVSLHIYKDLEQGSEEWLQARAGIVTASVVGQLITTKTIKPANNDTSRGLTAHLVAERITGYVEPTFTSADMERGNLSEPYARDLYAERMGAPVAEVGFMVREESTWKLGYSPDGMVGDDGLIEIKAPRQKKHLTTILSSNVPPEHMAQIQAGLLVSGREWLDFISYCGGMPLFVCTVYPDERWQKAIIEAAEQFETAAAFDIAAYERATDGNPPVERIDFYLDSEIVIK